jgi:nucleotide-binding universal stress UspA family protein
MLSHILVSLDGSELAEQALNYATKILPVGAKLSLLSVVDVPNMQVYTLYEVPMVVQQGDYDQFVANLERSGREYLLRVTNRLKAQGYEAVPYLEMGEPAAIIVDKARSLGVEAIVMSTHGRSGFSRWLFGSVTQKVLNAMPCPVFVVPGYAPEKVPGQAEENASRKLDPA